MTTDAVDYLDILRIQHMLIKVCLFILGTLILVLSFNSLTVIVLPSQIGYLETLH